MALGLVGRKSFIPFVVFAAASLAQGCFTTKGDDDSSSKGCTKDTDCAQGRICNNGTCMNQDDSSGGSSGSSGSGAILSGGTGGNSSGGSGNASGGTGGSKGGSGGSGTGGSATGGSGTGGSSGSSGGGSSGMCSTSDAPTCPSSDSMTFCLNGSETTMTCDYFCTTLGLGSGPCQDGYGCQCGDPTDQPCVDGVNAYCSCVSGTSQPCVENSTTNDALSYYVECHANDPNDQDNVQFLKCLGMQLPANSTLSTTICENAAVACGATPPDSGTGGTGGAAGTGGSAGTPPTP